MSNPNTAFEAITSRVAWQSTGAISRYEAVQWGATGYFEKADGTKPFAGIVEYGTDLASGGIITVVRGIFPAIAGVANLAKGDQITFKAGAAAKAGATDTIYGVAVSASTNIGDLVGVAIYETPVAAE